MIFHFTSARQRSAWRRLPPTNVYRFHFKLGPCALCLGRQTIQSSCVAAWGWSLPGVYLVLCDGNTRRWAYRRGYLLSKDGKPRGGGRRGPRYLSSVPTVLHQGCAKDDPQAKEYRQLPGFAIKFYWHISCSLVCIFMWLLLCYSDSVK